MENQSTVTWESLSGAVCSSRLVMVSDSALSSSGARPSQPQWYAIQTKYRCERKVTAQLQHKGWNTFLPVLRQIHRWSDRRKAVDVPLFSGYTFARLDLVSESRMEVLHTQGVIGLVSFGKEYVPIPDRQVDDLQRLLSRGVPCALRAFLKVGQRVRVRGGCLDGLEGILEENEGKNLMISIEAVQRSVVIQIDGYELELI